MKANPGGQIQPSEVVGRDELISNLWRVMERRSLVLSAERRMGKTCVIKKMNAEAPLDKLPIYHDLEGVRTPLEFVELIFQDVEGYLSTLTRTAARTRQWLAHLTGLQIGSVIKLPETIAPHWKTFLNKTIEDLVEHQDQTVVLFWDEMPLMLYNVKERDGEGAATEVLDALRSLRQMHNGLRMVFTGSIGLHNVISSLRRSGYANDPTNDMDTIEVPPLSQSHAHNLACQLLRGENIQTSNIEATARAIAQSVDGIPYFIHHIVDQVVQRGGVADVAMVGRILETCLSDPLDRWHLRYYRERIDTYYAPEERPFALSLLDVLSVADRPQPFDDLFNLLKTRLVTEDVEKARDVLTLLQRDHYVVQLADGAFSYRFPLIKRCWRLHRGLQT